MRNRNRGGSHARVFRQPTLQLRAPRTRVAASLLPLRSGRVTIKVSLHTLTTVEPELIKASGTSSLSVTLTMLPPRVTGRASSALSEETLLPSGVQPSSISPSFKDSGIFFLCSSRFNPSLTLVFQDVLHHCHCMQYFLICPLTTLSFSTCSMLS